MPGPEPLVNVGQIVGTHGVKGGLKVFPLTDFPARFEQGEVLFLKGVPHKILRSNWHGGQIRVQLEDIKDMTMAETLKWEYLSVPEGSVPKMAEGEFMAKDLVGMKVVDLAGVELGAVEEIERAPAQDLLRVGTTLVPFVSEFVKDINLEKRVITIKPIPGLFRDEEAESVVSHSPSKIESRKSKVRRTSP